MTGIPVYMLPVAQRRDFKEPRGIVYKGRIEGILIKLHPRRLACIGDVVSRHCINSGVKPTLLIIDGSTRRSSQTPLEPVVGYARENGFNIISGINPRGSISMMLYEEICNIIHSGVSTLMVIKGEEDLLTLPVMSCTPPGGVIVYGMPGMGAVVFIASRIGSRISQSRILSFKPSLI